MPTSHSQNPIPGILGDTPQVLKPFERNIFPHEQQGEEKNQKLPKRGIKPPYKRTQHK